MGLTPSHDRYIAFRVLFESENRNKYDRLCVGLIGDDVVVDQLGDILGRLWFKKFNIEIYQFSHIIGG